jgi:hypothetical protein
MKHKKLFLSFAVALICMAGAFGYILMQQGQAVDTSIVARVKYRNMLKIQLVFKVIKSRHYILKALER